MKNVLEIIKYKIQPKIFRFSAKISNKLNKMSQRGRKLTILFCIAFAMAIMVFQVVFAYKEVSNMGEELQNVNGNMSAQQVDMALKESYDAIDSIQSMLESKREDIQKMDSILSVIDKLCQDSIQFVDN